VDVDRGDHARLRLAIGFYDDYLKLVVGNSKGLAARYKYLAQSVAALGIAALSAALHLRQSIGGRPSLYVPFFKTVAVPMSTLPGSSPTPIS
jgi:phospho-N-acetylmuramoyl-pentapeptide-transferase